MLEGLNWEREAGGREGREEGDEEREEGAVCVCFAQQQIKIYYLRPLSSICAQTDHNTKSVSDFFLPCFFNDKINGIFKYFQPALILSSHEVLYMSILNYFLDTQ